MVKASVLAWPCKHCRVLPQPPFCPRLCWQGCVHPYIHPCTRIQTLPDTAVRAQDVLSTSSNRTLPKLQPPRRRQSISSADTAPLCLVAVSRAVRGSSRCTAAWAPKIIPIQPQCHRPGSGRCTNQTPPVSLNPWRMLPPSHRPAPRRQAEPRLLPASPHPPLCPEVPAAGPSSSSERLRRRCPAGLELPSPPAAASAPPCRAPRAGGPGSAAFLFVPPRFTGLAQLGSEVWGALFLPATIFFVVVVFLSPPSLSSVVWFLCFAFPVAVLAIHTPSLRVPRLPLKGLAH